MSTLTAAPAPRVHDARYLAIFAAWLIVALVAAQLGILAPERAALVPIAIGGGVLALTLAYFAAPGFRAFAQRVDLRIPIAFHILRLPIGLAFLWLMQRGELDPVFATRAGWGDVLAGGLAIAAFFAVPTTTRGRRALVFAWNVIGLLDILVVVATAQSILFLSDHPHTMFGLASGAWAAIPTFVVPVVIATHFLVFARLRASRTAQ